MIPKPGRPAATSSADSRNIDFIRAIRPGAAPAASAAASVPVMSLIVEGDNLAALKALLPTYHGKVKCIYIDPPYNTGNERCGTWRRIP